MDAVTANIAQANPTIATKAGAQPLSRCKNDFLAQGTNSDSCGCCSARWDLCCLIACVNVANLLLAKGTTRQKEIAVRSRSGRDSRKDIFTQFLTENLMLAFVGGVWDWSGLAPCCAASLPSCLADTLPSEADLQSQSAHSAVTAGCYNLAGLLFGCAPAWYARASIPAEALKGRRTLRNRRRPPTPAQGAGHRRVRAGPGAARRRRACHSQLLESHPRRSRREHRPRADLLSPVPEARPKDPAQINAYYQQMIASIKSVPGVQMLARSLACRSKAPGFGMPFTIAGQPDFADPSQRPAARLRHGHTRLLQDLRHPGCSRTLIHRPGQRRQACMWPWSTKNSCNKFFTGKDPLQQRLNGRAADSRRHQAGSLHVVADCRRLPQRASRRRSAKTVRRSTFPSGRFRGPARTSACAPPAIQRP